MLNQRDIRPELEKLGCNNVGHIYRNASTPQLYEEIVRRQEGNIAHLGSVVVRTGHHVGRSPKDKFIIEEPSSLDKIWWGSENKAMKEENFLHLFYRLEAYLQNKDVFIQDCYAGADPEYKVPIRVITETAWHSLFARNMFIQTKSPEEARSHKPMFTLINVPRFHAVPELDGTSSEAFILLHLGKKLVLIGDTSYAGEIKKAVFTTMNYILPQKSVLSMHCSANVEKKGDAFGVMPPVAMLTPQQAVYHFLTGYTAKVAGTEVGVTEPQATFSACFGAPFMALPPTVYGDLLMKKIQTHKVKCWLLNTGWSGEPYGKSERIKIAYSRAFVKNILDGTLAQGEFETDPIFGFMIPKACKGVASEVLNPINSTSDKDEYKKRAKKLAADFKENFKQFKNKVSKEILNTMP